MKQYTAIILCLLLLCSVFLVACSGEPNTSLEKVVMNASWAYNYKNVQELTEHSDLIAYVSIATMDTYEQNGIVMTKYQANIVEEIYGEKARTVEIIMTGGVVGKTLYEFEDDPLMSAKDEFLIFARKNVSGTYTILSGPQGRFVVKDDKVFSLNVALSEVRKASPYSSIYVNGMEKEQFISQIRDCLKSTN